MSITARLTALLLGLLALAGTHWHVYTLGVRHERNAAQAAQTTGLREGAVAAIQQADNTLKAQHDRAITETRIATDRLATAGELDRLRHDLAAARSTAASANACTADSAASDQLFAAMAADIATLAEQGADMAAAADGHAADALMLLKATTKD